MSIPIELVLPFTESVTRSSRDPHTPASQFEREAGTMSVIMRRPTRNYDCTISGRQCECKNLKELAQQ